jgi:glycoside/pentoside/hexuronide:cation symporter, GPH family
MARVQAITSAEDRVPVAAKIALGLGSIVGSFTGQLTKQLMTPIYVVALGLSPIWVSMGMIVFRLYDAVTDPVMGWVSDNTRTRWGRRRPFIFIGAILSALALPAMWFVSRDWSQSMQITWLVATGLILFTCATIYSVPYESLTLEMTPDYNERSRVMAFRSFLGSVGGLLIGWSWFLTQLPYFVDEQGRPDPVVGARALGIFAGIVILSVGLGTAFIVKERFYRLASHQVKVSLMENLKATFRNRSFRILATLVIFFITGTFLIGELGFFIRLYYVCRGDTTLAAKLMGTQATVWLLVSLTAVPIYQYIATHYGKTRALYVALGFCFAAAATRWWLITPEYPWLYIASMGILGFGMTGAFQVLPSMNADVVDSDELANNVRREGAFASVYAWFVKLSFTLGMALPGFIVSLCGFNVKLGAAQPENVMLAMRLTDALLPASLLVIPFLLLRHYGLSPVKVAEVRAALELRRGKI